MLINRLRIKEIKLMVNAGMSAKIKKSIMSAKKVIFGTVAHVLLRVVNI